MERTKVLLAGAALRGPENIPLLHLPPYRPELNPVETVWAYLRGNNHTTRTHHLN